jgi:methyltransferase-like protein/cyclopropane fatty-acyl-phospholipid synthase-like methyltransferase
MTETARHTSYDDVPYPGYAFPETHPDRLATLATLFGMSPPPVEGCRVLELGCAGGVNLLAMAEGLPASRFVGIDLSAGHIAAGRATLADLGLTNVTLEPCSILDLAADIGTFDYIICHGVYSWVPPEVQAKILAVCRQHLAANGVAYISYNTYPGWRSRGLVRDLMQYYTRQSPDPQTAIAQARDSLAFVIEAVPAALSSYRGLLTEQQNRISKQQDSYLLHDDLEEVNAPLYFHEFVERAARQGLQYLGNAEIDLSTAEHFPPSVNATLSKLGKDVVAREQYLDFLTNRMFRRTLLCDAGVPLCRDLSPDRLPLFQIASQAESVSSPVDIHSGKVEEFRGPNKVSASTGHAISKAALVYLAEIWPRSVSFDDLQVAARARLSGDAVVVQSADAYDRDTRLLAENLLQAFRAGVVELHVYAPRFVTEPGACPLALSLARRQARDGARVPNARQELVDLDPLSADLLRHLDGRHDRPALVERLTHWVVDNHFVLERFGRPVTEPDRLRAILTGELDTKLRWLARSALLVA